MNTKIFAIAALALATTGAFAGDYESFAAPAGAGYSRAVVAAGARDAVRNDQVAVGEQPLVTEQVTSKADRADVKAQAVVANHQARVRGELFAFDLRG